MTEGQLEDKPQNLGQLRMTWEPGPATIINIPASLAEKSISKTRLEVLELRNIGNPPEITFHHRDVRNGEVEICVHRHMMKLSTFFKACYRDIGSDQSCNSKIRKLQATLSSALEHSPRHRNGNSMGNLFYEKLELDLGYFLFVLKEENDDCDPKVVEAQDR
ncbi:hypothetical protein BJ508DRAFT_23078 [Ascobolus immersus RN42]|uniref:Uncharacterized protein n=1 Tax=Ascobolus immersus RN42 TaxID=1160509 RepID=A0A3N4HTD7_ASCIM|nr:hypothetical protein BJ508DRAFT_23078 [Ascobolus immersus RN42]